MPRWHGDYAGESVASPSTRVNNRLIDCTFVDAKEIAADSWTHINERKRKEGEREKQAHLVVFEHVLTISLRTNESASDLSREIYSFIHRERIFLFLSSFILVRICVSGDLCIWNPSALRGSTCAPATRVRFNIESALASRQILNVIGREICCLNVFTEKSSS